MARPRSAAEPRRRLLGGPGEPGRSSRPASAARSVGTPSGSVAADGTAADQQPRLLGTRVHHHDPEAELGDQAGASGRRTRNDSAPASSRRPPSAMGASLPPNRGEPSTRDVSPASDSRRAAASPEMPPPTTTTSGSTVPVTPASPDGGRHPRRAPARRSAEHVRIGVGRHAVTEVEDVTGRGGAGRDHRTGPLGQHRPRRAEQGRIEIALNRVRVPQPTTPRPAASASRPR